MTSLVHKLSSTEDGATAEITPEQRASAVWRHPKRAQIVALLPKRSPEWIARWLEEQYPLDAEDGLPHPSERQHRRWRLSARAIDRYRTRFAPETVPGIDLLPQELEDLIGMRPPLTAGPSVEIEQLDVLRYTSIHNLSRSMAQDAELEMIQPLTLEAQKQALTAVEKSVKVKSDLGLPGYERVPDRHRFEIDATTKNLNVELHGRHDPQTGQQVPTEPAKVAALRELLAAGPDAAASILAAAEQSTVDEGEVVAAGSEP